MADRSDPCGCDESLRLREQLREREEECCKHIRTITELHDALAAGQAKLEVAQHDSDVWFAERVKALKEVVTAREGEAAAMALVLNHEGHIEKLNQEIERQRESIKFAQNKITNVLMRLGGMVGITQAVSTDTLLCAIESALQGRNDDAGRVERVRDVLREHLSRGAIDGTMLAHAVLQAADGKVVPKG